MPSPEGAEIEKMRCYRIFDVFSTAVTRFLTTEWEDKNHGDNASKRGPLAVEGVKKNPFF